MSHIVIHENAKIGPYGVKCNAIFMQIYHCHNAIVAVLDLIEIPKSDLSVRTERFMQGRPMSLHSIGGGGSTLSIFKSKVTVVRCV